MTGTIQQLRTQAEQGISADVQTANNAIAQIAQINQQLGAAPQDSATATLEDQRDQDITQLSKLMNVSVVQGANNQISVYTSNGQQLVSGVNASKLSFGNVGTLTATSLWSARPKPGRSWDDHADFAGRHANRSGCGKSHFVGRDRRLPADARYDSAASAKSARRDGEPDVAIAVEPDDERKPGDVRRAVRV